MPSADRTPPAGQPAQARNGADDGPSPHPFPRLRRSRGYRQLREAFYSGVGAIRGLSQSLQFDYPPAARDRRPFVALFVPTLRGGGAEKAWVHLARGLCDRGVRADLILMERDGPYLPLIPPGIRIIDLADPDYSAASVRRLRWYLQRERPVALIAALKQACRVALVAKRLGAVDTRVIATLHGNLWSDDKRLDYRLGRRLLYSWADEIVAVSAGVADDFARHSYLPRERLKVIYNPVVSDEIRRRSREPVAHSWFDCRDVPVVLSAGRLSPEKDLATLIRAFGLVCRVRPCRLVILGEGPERPALESLVGELDIGDRVGFLGFVDNPYAYMARANLFAMSSRSEGLPNVLIEALSMGTPVVSTDCESGPREILEEGRHGALAPVGDVDRLARAMEEQLNAPPDLQARLRRSEDFSIDRVTTQYLAIAGIRVQPHRRASGEREHTA